MAFNPEVQERPNGPWTKDFRARVTRLREAEGLSLKQIGEHLGFSGPFVHGLLAGKRGHHMASKHCERVLAAVQQLEADPRREPDRPAPAPLTELGLDELVKQIHRLGFSVELKPL
jgi:transcriptional regulator with XRE-family HTH domain